MVRKKPLKFSWNHKISNVVELQNIIKKSRTKNREEKVILEGMNGALVESDYH